MDGQLWTLYAGAVVLLSITPGPNSLLAIANGARYGLRRTAFSSLGCSAGIVVLIALSMTGLGVLLAASETVFFVIKWLGAAYLIVLGAGLVRSRGSLADRAETPGTGGRCAPAPSRCGALFLQGFLVVVTNPKVLIFFVAFLPQFYVVEAPFFTQLAVLSGTFVVVEFAVEMCLAGFAVELRRRLSHGSTQRCFNVATGGLFIIAGAYLLGMERPG